MQSQWNFVRSSEGQLAIKHQFSDMPQRVGLLYQRLTPVLKFHVRPDIQSPSRAYTVCIGQFVPDGPFRDSE